MKNKLILAAIASVVCFTACKKGNGTYLTADQTVAALNTPKLQKNWLFDGYTRRVTHSSSGGTPVSVTNTTDYKDAGKSIEAFNDTTIVFENQKMICRDIDTTAGLMTFTPELDNKDGKNFLKYYYKQERIWYMFYQSSTSATITTELYSK